MSHSLTIEWHGPVDQVAETDVRLLPHSEGKPGDPIPASVADGRFSFSGLEAETCLLSFRYVMNGRHFDSCYFQLDLPDISKIQLELKPEGAQIEQMGFVNSEGEFVDMLIYDDERPWLARAVEDFPYLQTLAEFLVFRFHALPAADARSKLNQVLGDLAAVFPELEHLWPYQLKMLIQPAYLAQTTAAWKACLQHLLRNNLILMDDEKLYETLQEATELAQQEDEVMRLSDMLEWDSDTSTWINLDAFLAELKGKQMSLTPGGPH